MAVKTAPTKRMVRATKTRRRRAPMAVELTPQSGDLQGARPNIAQAGIAARRDDHDSVVTKQPVHLVRLEAATGGVRLRTIRP